jgi:hypothetical protein
MSTQFDSGSDSATLTSLNRLIGRLTDCRRLLHSGEIISDEEIAALMEARDVFNCQGPELTEEDKQAINRAFDPYYRDGPPNIPTERLDELVVLTQDLVSEALKRHNMKVGRIA